LPREQDNGARDVGRGENKLLYSFEDFVFDTDQRELRGSQLIPLQPQVFDVLQYLITNRLRVVSKDDLIGAIWGGRIVSESALATRINAARIALGDSGDEQRLIKTLPRKGLRFVGEVREKAPVLAPSEVSDAKLAFAPPQRPSIAVLPFTNMSSDPEQDYFADGITDDIITALSYWRWLFVIARNSTFAYRGRDVDVRQVGNELGVRYILEGSVRRSADRVRITAQLVETGSGAHLWANRYDRALDDRGSRSYRASWHERSEGRPRTSADTVLHRRRTTSEGQTALDRRSRRERFCRGAADRLEADDRPGPPSDGGPACR
jgi:TolB-like protein